eukprot:12399707-Karenia_brevis.AAC.1
MEILNGSSTHRKKYGIHTRSTGTVVGMCVSGQDKEIENSTASALTLGDLPLKIILKMNGAMLQQYP